MAKEFGWRGVLFRLASLSVAAVAAKQFFDDQRLAGSPGAQEKEHAPRTAAFQRGRGRDAETPTEIPWTGWKDILWRVYQEIIDDRLLAVAAGVAFYGILAIFPAIAALVSLYGLFADPKTISEHLSQISFFLPGSAVEIIGAQAERIAAKSSNTLGLTFMISFGIAMWSANAGMKAMFDALNVVYDEEEKRSFVKLNAESLLFTFLSVLFVLLALAFMVVLPIVLGYVGFGPVAETIVSLVRWPILLVVVGLALASLYRYGPSRNAARWHWVTWGSALSAVLWLAVSGLFSWYVTNLGNYNETYGSLGAAIGFMTWLWISVAVTLVGAELNAEMEHQTARDSTVGTEKPLGLRGATMADTLGKERE